MIGECTAEELKIGMEPPTLELKDPGISMQIRGRSCNSASKTIEVTTGEVAVALQEPVSRDSQYSKRGVGADTA